MWREIVIIMGISLGCTLAFKTLFFEGLIAFFGFLAIGILALIFFILGFPFFLIKGTVKDFLGALRPYEDLKDFMGAFMKKIKEE